MADRLAEFGAALLDPDLPVPSGIVGPDGKPSARRFAVYRNNVVVSLIEATAAAYPVVHKLVGEQFFRAMARLFVASEPPRSPIMLDYGGGFADFIAAFPPAASVPYLADVARLERAWSEAYHAAEARPAAPEDLMVIPADRFSHATLQLYPSVRLVQSPFPVVTIWRMNVDGGTPAPLDLGTEEAVLIVRPCADVHVRQIGTDSFAFVQALLQGQTTSEAARRALALNPRFDLLGNVADVLGLGLVTGWSDGKIEAPVKGAAHVS